MPCTDVVAMNLELSHFRKTKCLVSLLDWLKPSSSKSQCISIILQSIDNISDGDGDRSTLHQAHFENDTPT